ncbi:MAG: glycoside hydrolase family 78 protein [candidate division KSB1 bacterium]|nr:glycoside hydrolase family 78 protein [candidate division KSB1 bacterium]MDZ7398927.1 glycoside hydrolase family 78 protein [candidate division KSB1 bacterium]
MPIAPADHLRCENLINPLGIDTPFPLFSWQLHHAHRNERQTAYQIQLGLNVDDFARGKAILWDSHKVQCDRNYQIPYAGAPLSSFTRYFWRVRWWDSHDQVSPFSEVAWFETSALSEADWQAKWISMVQPEQFRSNAIIILGQNMGEYYQVKAIYLRKEFQTSGPIKSARAYVCGLGYYELRINGQKVGDHVLDPAQTDYQRAALYACYDITAYLESQNAIGVILGNGRHIKLYGYDLPKLFLQIHIEYQSGEKQVIISDGTWKVSHGPVMENGIYFGERYDARFEMPGWDRPDFDDSHWQNAIVVQGTKLAAQLLPPIRKTKTLRPQKISSPDSGCYVVDFGQNFTGWVKLTVQGPAGTEIRLRYAELLHEDGRLNTAPNQKAEATDTFILSGAGQETFEPKFTYHGFRYVEISGFPGVPTPDNIEGCFVHTEVEPSGQFSCSNELINRIHQNVLWGQLSNLHSLPTDCCQRDERYGWLGDAHLAAEQAIFNFDMANVYIKFLDDIQHSQKENGSLPDIAPNYLGPDGTHPADPAWGSAYLIIAWYLYWYYGDAHVLERHYPSMKKYVEFLCSQAEGHLIKKLGKYGDWCPPGSIEPKRTKLELTSTWFYYYDTLLLSQMAEVIEKVSDAQFYRSLAEQIKTAFNAAYLENDQYAGHWMSPVARSVDQTSNVLPLYLDMVPADKKEAVLNKLLHSIINDHDYHLDTGIIGTRYLLDVLTDNGHADIAYRIATQRSYPSWGYMIGEGATTLWERWEKITSGGMNSHNHIMLGSVDAWFYRAIAGINCIEPGWKKIRIKPEVFGDLKYATAKVKTVRGEIFVSWQKSEQHFELICRIPVGATAEVHLPLLWEAPVIIENSRILWEPGQSKERISDIKLAGRKGEFLVFQIGSGYYRLQMQGGLPNKIA